MLLYSLCISLCYIIKNVNAREVMLRDLQINYSDKKCPGNRLFRTEDNDPKTIQQCEQKCRETDGCKYFALGMKGSFKGVCMGCDKDSVLETLAGFNTYPLEPYISDMTCPGSRLFRTEDNDPKTIQQCDKQCRETDGCKYFTIGDHPEWGPHKGVCMGCDKDSVLKPYAGFNTYPLEPYISDMKCPFETEYQFRNEANDPKTIKQCEQKCRETDGCKYFVIGDQNGHHKGICMGCDEDSVLETHAGFNTYPLEPYISDMTCPGSRLFRTEDNDPKTIQQCDKQCRETDGCKYFTIGDHPEWGPHKGVCMGCDKDSVLKPYAGFNTYSLNEERP